MVVNIILVHIIGMLGTVVFWGANLERPDRGLTLIAVRLFRRDHGHRLHRSDRGQIGANNATGFTVNSATQITATARPAAPAP